MLLAVVVTVLVVAGHVAAWIFLINRLHAIGWPRTIIKLLSGLAHSVAVVGAILLAWWSLAQALAPWSAAWSGPLPTFSSLVLLYAACCLAVALGPLPISLWERRFPQPPAALVSNHSTLSDLSLHPQAGEFIGRGPRGWLVRLPRNEVLRLEVNEKRLMVPRLDPALDGLKIVHLSDLHFTGAIGRRFFEHVVQLANEMEPDLVAITGDLLDRTACIDWVPYTLGRLRATHGAFFVLGNHDLRVDWRRLRETLEDAGVIDLGGRWTLAEIRDCPVLLAGSELPWFSPAPNMADCPAKAAGRRPLRLLLSHSPDQIAWARRHDFDLLLAGHNHGGQICLPVIGPVFSPSRYGVRFAAGTFDLPPTLMHVSRGLSGKMPVRYHCPPELTMLVLSCPLDQSLGDSLASRRGATT